MLGGEEKSEWGSAFTQKNWATNAAEQKSRVKPQKPSEIMAWTNVAVSSGALQRLFCI